MNAISKTDSSIHYHMELVQGSEEWLQARCGLLTASEMKLIITPETLKPSNDEKKRNHFYELLAQRITAYVEPHYVSDDMLRGQQDEIDARALYAEKYAPVHEAGFITNNEWGFTLGYSPDGLVGEDGIIECKSRCQKHQIKTIITREIPKEHRLQCQTGLLVTKRKWLDYVSYCAGLPMLTIRSYPDMKIQSAIIGASAEFESMINVELENYRRINEISEDRLIPTARKIIQEIF
jgi:hypothetical protein